MEKRISLIPDFMMTDEGCVELKIPKKKIGYILGGSFVSSIHADCIVIHLLAGDYLNITAIDGNGDDGDGDNFRIIEHSIDMFGFSNGYAMWVLCSEVSVGSPDDLPICLGCWKEIRNQLSMKKKAVDATFYS